MLCVEMKLQMFTKYISMILFHIITYTSMCVGLQCIYLTHVETKPTFHGFYKLGLELLQLIYMDTYI